jgi:hypothetical protein
MADALILPPEGGEPLTIRGGSRLLFKAVAATTEGRFSLHERHIPAGGRRPPAHTTPTGWRRSGCWTARPSSSLRGS